MEQKIPELFFGVECKGKGDRHEKELCQQGENGESSQTVLNAFEGYFLLFLTVSTASPNISVISEGFLPSRVPNPNLSWERTKSYNLGLDLQILDGIFYDFVSKVRQKEVLSYCLSIVKDISWIDVPDFEKQVGLRESQSFMTSWGLFNQLVSRVEQLFFSEEKNKGGYTAQEFSEDIDREVWKPTREGRKLTPMEKNMQQAFLGCIASSAEVAGVPQRAGVPAQMSLQTPRE